LGLRFAPSSISLTGEARRSARLPSLSKEIQTNPNKSKENSLAFFGFIWWNRGFSMGYGESKSSVFALFRVKTQSISLTGFDVKRPASVDVKRPLQTATVGIVVPRPGSLPPDAF
jgi:hypothetical protein